MSSIFAVLDVYLTKMLVSCHSEHPLLRQYVDSSGFFYTSVFSLQNYLARNFYNLRFLALFVCFAINFILLFYKVVYRLCPKKN